MIDNPILLLNEINQGIVLIDDHLEIIFWNKCFEEIFQNSIPDRANNLSELIDSEAVHQIEVAIQKKNWDKPVKVRIGRSDNKKDFTLQPLSKEPANFILLSYSPHALVHNLNLIYSYSNDILAVTNEHFQIEFISPSVTEILGYTQGEFISFGPSRYLHWQDFDASRHKVSEAMRRKEKKLSIINRIKKKNGDYIWGETNLQFVYDSVKSGNTTVIAITRDVSEIMTARQELYELKEHLEEAQHLAKMGDWQLDLRTGRIKWSLSMLVLYEIDHQDPPKTVHEFFRFVHPEDHDYVLQYLKLLESNEIVIDGYQEIQFRIITARGNIKYIKSRFKAGRSAGLIEGINIDITTEVLSEKKFIKSEKNFRELVENFPLGIGIAKNNQRVYVNLKLAETFEVTREAFVQYPLDAFATPNTRGILLKRIKDLKEGKKVSTVFWGDFYTGKSNHLKTFEVHTSEIHWEGESARLAILIDVTELKEKQQIIEQSNSLLRLAQEMAGISTWSLNISNERMKTVDVIRKFTNAVYEEDRDRTFLNILNCVEGNGPYTTEFRVKTVNGGMRWFAEKGAVIRNDNNDAFEVIGVTRDITQEKLKELELTQAKVRAEELYKNQEAFFSVLGHDIRIPLNAIIGLADLLGRKIGKRTAVLNALRSSSFNLMYVANGLLDLTKSRSGRTSVNRVNFDLRELIEHLMLLYQFTAKKKGIQFSTSVARNIPPLLGGDMLRLVQILNNLLDNAIKFTPRGKVHLSATLSSQSEHRYVVQFKISDTGVGIPEDKLNFIFEPYQQLSADSGKRGSGLGLAIVKNLTTQLNGTIEVKSKLNSGTTFLLSLPLWHARAVKSKQDQDTSNNLNGRVVLYVEDADSNQFVIQNLLGMQKAKCEIAATGEQALKLIAKKKYDLILLDIQLPDINGLDLLRKITRSDINLHTPVIVFTADISQETQKSIFSYGAKDLIYKPYSAEPLLEKISQAIDEGEKITMRYYERIVKKNSEKLKRARAYALDDLDELSKGIENFKIDGDKLQLKKNIHKATVTLKNINARRLLELLETLQNKKVKKLHFAKVLQEIATVQEWLNVYEPKG